MRIIILCWILFLFSPCFALRADINGDGRVNLLDLAILAEEWLMEDYEMSYPDKLEVKGSITPSGAIGIYTKGADIEGKPAWYKDDATYLISYSEGIWFLSVSEVGYWQLDGESYTGDYIAMIGVSGTATVTAVAVSTGYAAGWLDW